MSDGEQPGPFQMRIKNQNPFEYKSRSIAAPGSFSIPDPSKATLDHGELGFAGKQQHGDEQMSNPDFTLPKIKTVAVTPKRSHAIMEKYNRFKALAPFASTTKKARKASHQALALGGTLKLNQDSIQKLFTLDTSPSAKRRFDQSSGDNQS